MKAGNRFRASSRRSALEAVRRAGQGIAKHPYGIDFKHDFAIWLAFMALPGIPMVARAVRMVARNLRVAQNRKV